MMHVWTYLHFPGGASGKDLVCQCRRWKKRGLDPWVGKIPGGGHGNPLQYSCLENPMDRGAWQATVHGAPQCQTWPEGLSTHAPTNWLAWMTAQKQQIEKCLESCQPACQGWPEHPPAHTQLQLQALFQGSSLKYAPGGVPTYTRFQL